MKGNIMSIAAFIELSKLQSDMPVARAAAFMMIATSEEPVLALDVQNELVLPASTASRNFTHLKELELIDLAPSIGRSNAWQLTTTGRAVARRISKLEREREAEGEAA